MYTYKYIIIKEGKGKIDVREKMIARKKYRCKSSSIYMILNSSLIFYSTFEIRVRYGISRKKKEERNSSWQNDNLHSRICHLVSFNI